MRLSTPLKIQHLFYFGIDTSARHSIGDELLGIGICRLYAGIYPTRRGFDLSMGITDQNGCL